MAITYQFNAKRHNVKKINANKRRNIRKQKGTYNVNDTEHKPVTSDRKERREEKKRQKKIAKKARKADKKNKMQTEEQDDEEDMQDE